MVTYTHTVYVLWRDSPSEHAAEMRGIFGSVWAAKRHVSAVLNWDELNKGTWTTKHGAYTYRIETWRVVDIQLDELNPKGE